MGAWGERSHQRCSFHSIDYKGNSGRHFSLVRTLGQVTSLSHDPETPSTPSSSGSKSLKQTTITKCRYSKHLVSARQMFYLRSSHVLSNVIHVFLLTLINTSMHALCHFLRPGSSSYQLRFQLYSNRIIPLLRCNNCIKCYNHTVTTSPNCSPNSKEVKNFNYLYYIYREWNAFFKSYQWQHLTLNFMKSL